MKKILITAIIVIVGMGLNPIPTTAQTTIYVKPDGIGDGSSWTNACNIDDAVVRAGSAHPTIWVQTGTYYPKTMLTLPNTTKMYGGFKGTETNLLQRDSLSNATIIDAQKKYGSVVRMGTDCELNGFVIRNGNAQHDPLRNGGGVWADDSCVVANCVITGNAATIEGNKAEKSGDDLFGNCTRLYAGGGFSGSGTSTVMTVTPKDTVFIAKTDTVTDTITLTKTDTVVQTLSGIENPPALYLDLKTIAQTTVLHGVFPTLNVGAIGSGTFTYQWYQNSESNTTDGTPVTGANSPSFIPPSSAISTAYYYCVVTTEYGTVKSSVSGLHTVASMGCNSSTIALGTVKFATPNEWTIGSQRWSDVVTASGCNKTTYNGGNENNYNADCRRATNGFSGHYFSWCAVVKYGATLCPAPWRVPTKDDFVALDKTFGGNGAYRSASPYGKYCHASSGSGTSCTNAAGTWGGSRFTAHATALTTGVSYYWSSTQNGTANANTLTFSGSDIQPLNSLNKNRGFALRCVR